MLKRVLLGIVGALLVLVAGIAGALAAWGYLTFAGGGSLRFDLGTVVPGETDTAIVLDVARFGASIPYLDALGETQLAARSAEPDGAATSMFVGAATTADADAFVKGTAYAVGLRDAAGWQVRQIPGALPLPATSSVGWLAQSTGTTALVDVPTTRPLTVVLARADGAPVGAVALAADFAVPQAQTWALWIGVGALVLLVAGVVLLLLALRRRRARGAHEAGSAPESTASQETVAVAAAVASDADVGTQEPVAGSAEPDGDSAGADVAAPTPAEPAPVDDAVVDETAAEQTAEPTPAAADEPADAAPEVGTVAADAAASGDEPVAAAGAEPARVDAHSGDADAHSGGSDTPAGGAIAPGEDVAVAPTADLDATAELPVVAALPEAHGAPDGDEHQPS